MASVYFHDRREAGDHVYQAMIAQAGTAPVAVVALGTEATVTAAQVATLFRAPLHLFMSEEVSVPGNLVVGTVDSAGSYTPSYGMSSSDTEYWYSEFRGHIDQTRQQNFSSMNRKLGGRVLIRNDLLKDRVIIVVADALTDPSALSSLMTYLKPVTYKKLLVGVPIVTMPVYDYIKQIADFSYTPGIVDFFYGVDHYFEDNTTWKEDQAISLIQKSLATWPA